MPIDKSELKEAQRPLENRIYDFLNQQPDKAFMIAEIITGVEGEDPQIVMFEVIFEKGNPNGLYNRYKSAMENLINNNRLEYSLVRGLLYYAVRE